jgi:cytidine deaminase
MKEQLIEQAKQARTFAYTPYSQFNVGCAILLKDGTIIKGANIENASYGLTNCAERSALFAAYSQGYREDDIQMMAIVGDTDDFISPCGACRQVIHELVNEDTEIILTNMTNKTKIVTKTELLPYGFSKKDLE